MRKKFSDHRTRYLLKARNALLNLSRSENISDAESLSINRALAIISADIQDILRGDRRFITSHHRPDYAENCND